MTGHRIEDARLNRILTDMRAAGHGVYVARLVDQIVHGRTVQGRQEAMVDLLLHLTHTEGTRHDPAVPHLPQP